MHPRTRTSARPRARAYGPRLFDEGRRCGPPQARARFAASWQEADDVHVGVRVTHPGRDMAVVTVNGDVDDSTIGHLTDILWPRLDAEVSLLAVDLTTVGFLGVPGLRLLNLARLRAEARGITLRIVTVNPEVIRALRIAGLATVQEERVPTARAAPH